SSALGDVSFPPSMGTIRNDMGHRGGPAGALWNSISSSEPLSVFSVQLGHVVLWDNEANTYLEHAVSVSGPWYRYMGDTITVNGKQAVLIDFSEPRKFFRLARLQ